MRTWSTAKKLIWLRGSPISGGPFQTYGPGDIVSFETAKAKKLKELLVTLEPIQNLNGYSSPWPAGGGVNKMLLSTSAKSGTVDGVTYSYDPKTEKISLSGTNDNTTSHSLKGFSPTADGLIVPDFQVGETYTLLAYLPTSMYCQLVYKDGNNANIPIGYISGTGALSSVTFTIPDDYASFFQFQTYVKGTATTISGDIYFEIVSGSTAPTAWTPYENLCPILGRASASAWRNGINQWDEEWEEGNLSTSTGEKTTGGTRIRSKNYIPILPNTEYCTYFQEITGNYTQSHIECFYDADHNFISGGWTNVAKKTTPANAYYMMFASNDDNGTTYNNDISINYPSTDTDYHAYVGTEYAVTFPVLGKNKCPQATTQTSNQVTFTALNDGGYALSGTATGGNAVLDIGRGSLSLPAGTYYASLTGTSNADNTVWKVVDGTTSLLVQGNGSFTLTENTDVFFRLFVAQGTTATGNAYVQVEEGSSASAFEPYTTTVYQGTLEIVSGVLTVLWQMVYLSTISFRYDSSVGHERFISVYPLQNAKPGGRDIVPNAISSQYKVTSSNAVYSHRANSTFSLTGEGRAEIYDSRYTDADAFNNAMAGVQICYELATPLVFQLTPQQIMSLVRKNNVWSNAGQVTVRV